LHSSLTSPICQALAVVGSHGVDEDAQDLAQQLPGESKGNLRGKDSVSTNCRMGTSGSLPVHSSLKVSKSRNPRNGVGFHDEGGLCTCTFGRLLAVLLTAGEQRES
jgi:hypothetical protein